MSGDIDTNIDVLVQIWFILSLQNDWYWYTTPIAMEVIVFANDKSLALNQAINKLQKLASYIWKS